MKHTAILLLFILATAAYLNGYAQDTTKVYNAIRTAEPPKIDGVPDEQGWQMAPVMDHFYQYQPLEGTHPDHPMEVRIVYDDEAIYVSAVMYDTAPDSIRKELGARDADNINADYFRICLDPYHKHQDAYFFGVYASGVQFDYRVSDNTYDAVWESAVKITDQGWIAEIKIPYSAIRFPKTAEQSWSMQVNRSVRRTREFCQWSKTPSSANNPQLYWGTLNGISNVTVPVRLSFTPYLSGYLENAPLVNSEGNLRYSNSFSYNAGADVKYGIDERFTLDMTLFPDFGQVQSDNKIKNLSYREVTYDENRPFFKESVELFDKNNLFYSRRIGKIPSGYFNAGASLLPGETLEENPPQAKLLNAFKLSGRTGNGLGVGLFNAITANTYAVISDSTGAKRKLLTEPLTNYNVLVFDQQFKNNSNAYLINTNVLRDNHYTDANVTGAGFRMSNKKNTMAFEGNGAASQKFTGNDAVESATLLNNNTGYSYSAVARKLGGWINYGGALTVYDDKYYTSDLGYQVINSRVVYEGYMNFNLYKPWKFLRNSYNGIYYNYATHYITGKTVNNQINTNVFVTFLSYFSIYGGGGFTPSNYYDYFEPRVPGRFQKSPKYYFTYAGLSSDYRKKVALDYTFTISNFIDRFVGEGYESDARLRYRISDKLTLRLNSNYAFDPYNLGFVDIDSDNNIIYGLRIKNTYINQLEAKYIFKNDMYVAVNARHYWVVANYRKYLTLLNNGEFESNYEYGINNNFNYNAFNIDFIYSWQFAPGSILSFVYKNAIENDAVGIVSTPKYDTNLKTVLSDPQTNSISLKLLYYLDYLTLRKKFKG